MFTPDQLIIIQRWAIENRINRNALRRYPVADQVRIYFRMGRKYTKVFWAPKNSDIGAILFFVDADGVVYRPKSSKAAGAPTGESIDL